MDEAGLPREHYNKVKDLIHEEKSLSPRGPDKGQDLGPDEVSALIELVKSLQVYKTRLIGKSGIDPDCSDELSLTFSQEAVGTPPKIEIMITEGAQTSIEYTYTADTYLSDLDYKKLAAAAYSAAAWCGNPIVISDSRWVKHLKISVAYATHYGNFIIRGNPDLDKCELTMIFTNNAPMQVCSLVTSFSRMMAFGSELTNILIKLGEWTE